MVWQTWWTFWEDLNTEFGIMQTRVNAQSMEFPKASYSMFWASMCNLENGACNAYLITLLWWIKWQSSVRQNYYCFCIRLRMQVHSKILQHALSPRLTSDCVPLSLLACFQLLLLRVQPLHLPFKSLRPGTFLPFLLINAGAASFNGLSVGNNNLDCTIKWNKCLAISTNSCEAQETLCPGKTKTPASIC